MTEQAPETQSGVVVAQIQNTDESQLVAIVLAHPLNKKDKERLGIDVDTECGVNTTVKVLEQHARTLIGAGYAQVDPEDHDAVRKVLRGDTEPVDTGAERLPGEGTDQDAAPAPAKSGGKRAQQPVTPASSSDPAAPVPTSGNQG